MIPPPLGPSTLSPYSSSSNDNSLASQYDAQYPLYNNNNDNNNNNNNNNKNNNDNDTTNSAPAVYAQNPTFLGPTVMPWLDGAGLGHASANWSGVDHDLFTSLMQDMMWGLPQGGFDWMDV